MIKIPETLVQKITINEADGGRGREEARSEQKKGKAKVMEILRSECCESFFSASGCLVGRHLYAIQQFTFIGFRCFYSFRQFLFSNHRPEWQLKQFGVALCGALTQKLNSLENFNLSPHRSRWRDSKARWNVASSNCRFKGRRTSSSEHPTG